MPDKPQTAPIPTDMIIRALRIWEKDLRIETTGYPHNLASWIKEAADRLEELSNEKT